MNGPQNSEQVMAEANRLAASGQYGAAIRLLAEGIEADRRLVRPFARLAAGLVPASYRPELDRGLAACFAEQDLDCQPLSRCAAALLLLKYPEPVIAPLGEDPLWVGFLTRCINTHPAMETRLAATRRTLLGMEPVPLGPACALALQAFAGEYVWPVTVAEMERLASTGSPLLRALYAPLAEPPDGDDPLLRLLVEESLTALEVERALAASMPSLDLSRSIVSAAVRDQYEEHPYPRWRIPPTPRPAALADVLARLPGVDGPALPPPPLNILVAGCGTGFEAIEIARTDPSARVTALDLSRASLAYGKRMAGGLPNLRFIQGDILDVATLDETFGLVTSTGVLHHMESPEAGLAALRDVTSPGGMLRIALYSERARMPVRLAHAVIREKGLAPSDEGIRRLRAHILTQPDDAPLAILRQSDDFYSLSGCRDLLFHVHEHWFTPLKVAELLDGLGLRLAGFDAPPEALRTFRQAFGAEADPLDLRAWDLLEQRHPFLFAGMYHLWCQKPA